VYKYYRLIYIYNLIYRLAGNSLLRTPLSTSGSMALVDLGRFFSFLIYTQSVGLFGRGISPSQGRNLHTKQHKHRINTQDIHASSGIRTHDLSVRAGEHSSCFRPPLWSSRTPLCDSLMKIRRRYPLTKFRLAHNFLWKVGCGEHLKCCHIAFNSIAFSNKNICRLKFYRGTSLRNHVMVFVGAYFRTSYIDTSTICV
jgi:hypothetical protein